MVEDKALMLEFISGNQKAFESLVLKHRKRALLFASHYIKDLHIAEDITQEAFAAVYVHKESYNERYSFKTYLYTIIRNKCVDYLRRNRLNIYTDIATLEQSIYYDPNLSDDKHFLYSAIEHLKPEYKRVIYIIDIEGFSYKEAAKILCKTLANVKITLYRARRCLKAFIEQEEGYNEGAFYK